MEVRCSDPTAIRGAPPTGGVAAWLLSLLAACATAPEAGPTAESPVPPQASLSARLVGAAQTRDLNALLALRAEVTADPQLRAELARALYWTAGVAEAAPELRAVCEDPALPADGPARAKACAVLAFQTLAQGRPLNVLKTPGEGAFLPKQKLFIAMISINDGPPQPFIVDTGAPTTIIAQRYADQVGLPYDPGLAEVGSDSAGHPVYLHPVILQAVQWGGIRVEQAPAHVLALPENFKVGGILAPQDLLRGQDFEIDGPAAVLRVPAEPDPGAFGRTQNAKVERAELTWGGGNLYVQAQVDQLPALPFLFDLGAGANGVCEEVLAQHPGTLTGGDGGQSATAAGTTQVRTGLKGSFAVASEPRQDSELFAKPCPADPEATVEKAGYVGAPWFWARQVYFPKDRKSVLFTIAGP